MGRFVTGLNLINEFRYSLSNMNRVLLSILTTLLFYTNSYIEIVAYLNKNNGQVTLISKGTDSFFARTVNFCLIIILLSELG